MKASLVPTPASSRRGMIILSVLVIIMIAALLATTAMHASGTAVESARASIGASQSRSLAWSGVQAVMAELAEQRADVIAGREPVVTKEWELFKGGSGSRMVVRLVPLAGEAVIESESAKLNVNTAAEAMLAAAPGMTPELAAAVVAARGSRPFQSVADLARVEGMEALLTGEATEAGAAGSTRATEAPSDAGPLAASILTAISFEPGIQFGVGPRGADRRGQRRVDLNIGPSEALTAELGRRFDAERAERFGKLFRADRQLKNRTELAPAGRDAGLTPEDWSIVLDQFEPGPDPYHPGRIDLNRAPAEVLACIPGIGPELAAKVVQARDSVAAEARAGVAWPLEQGILTAPQFAEAMPHLTTRSFQWRVVVEAGVAEGTEEERNRPLGELTLRNRTVLEAIIDIASQRPRIAYLRDVTLLEAAAQVEAAAPPPEEEPALSEPVAPPSHAPAPSSPAPPAPPPAQTGAQKPEGPPPAPPKLEAKDRRVGRWTAGGGTP